MTRRPLGTMLTELAAAVTPDPDRHPGLRATHLTVEVPVEAALHLDGDDLLFIADLPRWRWRSDFDREPGRMTMNLHEGQAS